MNTKDLRVWGGRREECSGWGTHVCLWQIHFDIWQNQYNIVKFSNKIKKRDYSEQLYGNKIDNLEEMDRFLEKFNLPRLNQKEIEIMNNPITSTEIEAVIKKISPKTKAQDQMASQENSIKHLEKS